MIHFPPPRISLQVHDGKNSQVGPLKEMHQRTNILEWDGFAPLKECCQGQFN